MDGPGLVVEVEEEEEGLEEFLFPLLWEEVWCQEEELQEWDQPGVWMTSRAP